MELGIGIVVGVLLSGILSYFIYQKLTSTQTDQFESLANTILQKNEQNLNTLVSPFNERVKEYRDYLEQMHKFDLKDRESLRERLNQMLESASKIEVETHQLSTALKSDVKFQGAWGELTLERILDLAGLVKGQEYSTQSTYQDEQGKSFKPDVVVNLPNNASIIIDSKVSLTSYFEYINEDKKDEALKKIKISIMNHIDSLSKKNYQSLNDINSPDFIYLFVPVEGVYSLMLKEFPEIIDQALKKNIVLVSPVNLIANLKTVASLWRLEKQSKNAQDLATKAGAMYDKFVAILDDLEKLGNAAKKTSDLHEDIVKKLSTGKGNLIGRAEELRSLGAKTTKEMDSDYLN